MLFTRLLEVHALLYLPTSGCGVLDCSEHLIGRVDPCLELSPSLWGEMWCHQHQFCHQRSEIDIILAECLVEFDFFFWWLVLVLRDAMYLFEMAFHGIGALADLCVAVWLRARD